MKKLFTTIIIGIIFVFLYSIYLAYPTEASDISCGDTITTDTVLTHDLLDCPRVGLIIRTNGITLDCAGHTIDSSETHTVGILVGYDNVTIKNCVVTDFYSGIEFSGADNGTIYNNTIYNNRLGGIRLFSGNSNIIEKNRILSGGFEDIALYSSSKFNIIHNNFISQSIYGIYITFSNNNTIQNNTASENRLFGTYLISSSYNKIIGNHFSKNEGYGIRLYSNSNSNTLKDNIVSDSFYSGLYITQSNNNLIYNNYFNNTRYYNSNALDDGSNIWNTTKTLGKNIVGGSFIGGNFWSDYNGTDADGDDIGDTNLPYNSGGYISQGGDFLPLTAKKSTPVLLLHGYMSDPSAMETIKISLENDGFTVYNLDYEPGDCTEDNPNGCANGDIRLYAIILSAEINRIRNETGAEEVDIVSHSMGGLISRWYVQRFMPLKPQRDVRHVIMLGTPNNGSEHCSFLCPGTAGDQMTPGSDFLIALKSFPIPDGVVYSLVAGTNDNLPFPLNLQPDLPDPDDGEVRVASVADVSASRLSCYFLNHFDLHEDGNVYLEARGILRGDPTPTQNCPPF